MTKLSDIVFVTGNPEKAERFARHIRMAIGHAPAELDEIQTLDTRKLIEHKARQAYEQLQKPVLVEDVEFVFRALGTLPGPFIKYFVQVENGGEKMRRLLDGFTDRGATASCTYAYFDGQNLETFTGSITGVVAQSPRGSRGYGFDKVFEPDGFGGKTAGELTGSEYDDYYTTIKPFAAVREFLQELSRG